MSNWCLGCGREIPNGDYCGRYCRPVSPPVDENERRNRLARNRKENKKGLTVQQQKEQEEDDIPF